MGLMQHERYCAENATPELFSLPETCYGYGQTAIPYRQNGPINIEFLPQEHTSAHGQHHQHDNFPSQSKALLNGKNSVAPDARFLKLDTTRTFQGDCPAYAYLENPYPVFSHNDLQLFNKRPNNYVPAYYGPFTSSDRQTYLPLSSGVNYELQSPPEYSDVFKTVSACQSRAFSSIDPRELFHKSLGSVPASGSSSAFTSFDGPIDQTYGTPETDGSPRGPTTITIPAESSYNTTMNMGEDNVSHWNADNQWAMEGDSGPRAGQPRHGLPSYTTPPPIANSTRTVMPQGALYSMPTDMVSYHNTTYTQSNVNQRCMPYNLGTAGRAMPFFAENETTISTPATPYIQNWQHSTHDLARVHESNFALPSFIPLQPTPDTKKEQCPIATPSISPAPSTNGPNRRFTVLNPNTAASRRPNKPTRATQAPAAHPNPASKDKDLFLVQAKRAGMPYKEIRVEGGFEEAESTLRGRFRSLTKAKSARVRKPVWTKSDIRLLEAVVAKLTPSGADVAAEGRKRSAVPWKKVAEEIYRRGGSYLFGNATCKKKWDKLYKM